jgi:hypothetical protein
MKHIALGAVFALSLTTVSWTVLAEEQSPEQDKATMEDKCRAMGEQHGMKDEKMDAWMKKCIDIVTKMRENKKTDDGSGEQAPQEGDSNMGGKPPASGNNER